MDNRPIGIYDSGVGGFSSVKVLRELLPSEDIIYVGDSARMPYGGRNRDELITFSLEITEFLMTHDVKAILVACNTSESVAINLLRETLAVPVFGLIETTAKVAIDTTENGTIGIMATPVTANNMLYERSISEIDDYTSTCTVACPRLARLIEDGKYTGDEPDLLEEVQKALKPILKSSADTLILGCTHYTQIAPLIRKLCGTRLRLVDSGAIGAMNLVDYLVKNDMQSGNEFGEATFYTTGDLTNFYTLADLFMGDEADGNFETLVRF